MLYEFAFSCSAVGEDSPFCLCQGYPRKLIPCSTQHIADVDVSGLLIVDRGAVFELTDPINLLPFNAEVCGWGEGRTWVGEP
jgi:hypothetical protein